MTDKPFKTIAEQLDILRSRNLSISNPVLTSSLLSAYGYYEIINGYKSPFLTNPNSKEIDHYGDEIDFLNVFSLFRFDMELREQVLGIIELFESTLRQRVAYIFSKNHTEDQKELFNDKVLKPGKRNYDKQGHFVNYERDGFYHKLNKIINDDVDPFVHYREKHGNVPPWIVVKGMSFGNLRMFVHLMREEDQKEVIQSMYLPFFREAMSYDQLRQFFFETLELIRKFRNRSAHGGRIYNYSPNVSITFQPSFHSLIGISKAKYSKRKLGRNDLITLLGAFKVFNNQDPYNRLMISILSQLNSLFKVEPTLKNKIILAMNLPENYEQMIRIENSKPWNPKYLWEE